MGTFWTFLTFSLQCAVVRKVPPQERAAAAAISAAAPFLTILAPPLNYTRFTNQETYCRGLDEDIIDEHFLKLPEIDIESFYKSFNQIE